MRHRHAHAKAAVALLLVAAACSTTAPGGVQTPGSTRTPGANADVGYDAAAASEQARTFRTMATPDTWANYGEQFTRFCIVKFGFDCNREDRDIGDGLSSAQEVTTWDAERNNPQSVLADIGILFIPQATAAGVLADYEPPNANLLPDDLHGPGWVATFVGVPTILANVDYLESRGLPVPESWEDLTDPAFGSPPLVGMSQPGVGASSTFAFVAMNLALGGTLDNWQPGIDYGRRLLPNVTQQATIETFERGEVPIAVRFDFQQARWFEQLDERQVGYRVIVPAEGSVFGASTLMMNRYDTAHADFARMFLEWVVTDEGQLLFAKFGSRPIRSVAGENRLAVPAELRRNWLPEDQFVNVRHVDWRRIDSERIADMWANDVVGGG